MTTFTARYPGRRCGVCDERINVGDTATCHDAPAHAACSTADLLAGLRALTEADAKVRESRLLGGGGK